MTSVAPLTRAAADVLGICDSLGRRACLIGGIAVQRWGQPRATQDVDVTVLAPVGSEAAVVDELLASLTPRVPDGLATWRRRHAPMRALKPGASSRPRGKAGGIRARDSRGREASA